MDKKSFHRAPSTTDRGKSAEAEAALYLEAKGYQCGFRNFRWRGGEIDLVMIDRNGMLVFVEVRSAHESSPWLRYSIGAAKRRRLIHTAETFLLRHREWRGKPFRFDVIWIENSGVEHWQNVLL